MNPDQHEKIQTWSTQRDSLLNEISVLEKEKETLLSSMKEINVSFLDIQNRVLESEGRISELLEHENRIKNSLSNDIVDLYKEKSELESSISIKSTELAQITHHVSSTKSNFDSFDEVFDRSINRLGVLDKILHNVMEMTSDFISKNKSQAKELDDAVSNLIVKSEKNLEQHESVVKLFQKLVFELSRPNPVARIAKEDQNLTIEK